MYKTTTDIYINTCISIMLSLLKTPALPDLIQPSGPG